LHAAVETLRKLPDTAFAAGSGYLRVAAALDRYSVVTHARATSPLRLFTPRTGASAAWIVTSTLGGGLVGGDEIQLILDVEPGAHALVTSQASTKVYRSARSARQTLEARIGDDSLLVLLPDAITAFSGSTFEQRQSFALGERASLLALDWMTSGRRASGERWAFDRYASRVEAWRCGRRIFFDHLQLDRADGPIRDRMRHFNVYAMALIAGPAMAALAAALLESIGALPVERRSEVIVSVAPFDGDGAIVRVAGVSVEPVAATLRRWFLPVTSLVGADPWARRW
jgi:urease accessory protein